MMTLLQPPNVKAELTLLLVQPEGQGLDLFHTHGGTITHDPICRWTLTFNELFNVDTQANGDGSLSLFCSYDLFLCKYYEILLLLLEIFLVLGSCLIMLVPYLSQSRLLSCHQRPCGNQSCLCVLLFLLSPQSYPCVCLVTLSPGPCVYLFIISLCSVLLCPQ